LNQAILINDDWDFDDKHDAWCCTALLSGQHITIYFHSMQLKLLTEITNCTKFDLEDVVELWLEKNEPENEIIHINMR